MLALGSRCRVYTVFGHDVQKYYSIKGVMDMKKQIIPMPERFISYKKAKELYGFSEYKITNIAKDKNKRVKVKIDRSVRYDKNVLDEMLAGNITIGEIPLYKRFASVKVAMILYDVARVKLLSMADSADAICRHGKSIFIDTWALDEYLEELKG